MELSLSLDYGITTPRSGKSDKTTNRTVGDIWKTIDAQFEDDIRAFLETNYSGSQRREIPQKGK